MAPEVAARGGCQEETTRSNGGGGACRWVGVEEQQGGSPTLKPPEGQKGAEH